MAHGLTGAAGVVTWGGGAINGKLREWTAEFTGNTTSDRGAGESWESRIATFNDWSVSFTAFALDQADWSLSSAATEASLIGTTTTISLKRKSGDTNPWFTATGMTTSIRRRHEIENASEYEVTVQCSEGVLPTVDTTPAT